MINNFSKRQKHIKIYYKSSSLCASKNRLRCFRDSQLSDSQRFLNTHDIRGNAIDNKWPNQLCKYSWLPLCDRSFSTLIHRTYAAHDKFSRADNCAVEQKANQIIIWFSIRRKANNLLLKTFRPNSVLFIPSVRVANGKQNWIYQCINIKTLFCLKFIWPCTNRLLIKRRSGLEYERTYLFSIDLHIGDACIDNGCHF